MLAERGAKEYNRISRVCVGESLIDHRMRARIFFVLRLDAEYRGE